MKLRKHSLAFLTMFVLGTATFMGGCAMTGMDRSEKASNSMRDVDTELRKMNVQIDTTAASLDVLVKPDNSNLKKNFDTYSENVVKLEKEGKRVLKRIEEMKERNSEYFEEWEKEGDTYRNAEIRELSDERRIKLAEIYAHVPEAGTGIKGNYTAYLVNLKEIQKYLSNDLTVNGVQAIVPVAQKAVKNSDALKASLKPVIAAMDEIKAELYEKKKK